MWTGDERWRTRCPPHQVQEQRRRDMKSTAVPLQGTVHRSRHGTRIALRMVQRVRIHTFAASRLRADFRLCMWDCITEYCECARSVACAGTKTCQIMDAVLAKYSSKHCQLEILGQTSSVNVFDGQRSLKNLAGTTHVRPLVSLCLRGSEGSGEDNVTLKSRVMGRTWTTLYRPP